MKVFAQITPAFNWSATFRILEPFSVQIPALRPNGVLLALATASAGVLKVSTDSTGPKISSRATVLVGATPVITVGAYQKPFFGISQFGAQASPPSLTPSLTSLVILSSWTLELMAPMSVFLSSGSPSFRFPCGALVFSLAHPGWILELAILILHSKRDPG